MNYLVHKVDFMSKTKLIGFKIITIIGSINLVAIQIELNLNKQSIINICMSQYWARVYFLC